jgi:hypothetical protein
MSIFFRRLFILTLALWLLSACGKNANNANTYGARANTLNTNQTRPGDPARIEGDMPDYEVLTAELKYIQTFDVPAVRFAFKTGSVEMPSGAKDILAAHWKEALKYYYDDYFNKPQDASSLYDRQRAWAKYCGETDKKLQEISIAAPDGSRAITAEEARGIHTFLNQAADQVIDKAKSVQQPAK